MSIFGKIARHGMSKGAAFFYAVAVGVAANAVIDYLHRGDAAAPSGVPAAATPAPPVKSVILPALPTVPTLALPDPPAAAAALPQPAVLKPPPLQPAALPPDPAPPPRLPALEAGRAAPGEVAAGAPVPLLPPPQPPAEPAEPKRPGPGSGGLY
jgi:hypothetical protein